MIELKECCKVPYPEKLFEEYEVREHAIHANVGASKVVEMMKTFIRMHEEPLFFILELPCEEDDGGITESKKLIHAGDDRDVYFIDGLDAEQACQCLDNLGAFLVRDGMNTFGIGGHDSGEEILFAEYNVMTIYTRDAQKYRAFLRDFGIKETDTLVTAWDTFDQDHPGECKCYRLETTGKTIYDIPEVYKEYGMYLYETRKSWVRSCRRDHPCRFAWEAPTGWNHILFRNQRAPGAEAVPRYRNRGKCRTDPYQGGRRCGVHPSPGSQFYQKSPSRGV